MTPKWGGISIGKIKGGLGGGGDGLAPSIDKQLILTTREKRKGVDPIYPASTQGENRIKLKNI